MLPRTLIGASLRPFVLSIVAEGPAYGYQIIKRVHELTEGQIKYTTSTLYPVLHSLQNDGYLRSYWVESETERKRKYYRLTPEGSAALEQERSQWMSVHGALMKLWNPPVIVAPTS